MGKRIFLFILTNLAVVLTLTIVLSILGVGRYVGPGGLNIGALATFCFVWGMGGAFISLQMSRWMAKMATGMKIVDGRTGNADADRVYAMVAGLTQKAGLPMPEVGVYDSPEVNAFATGPSKNRALVAVSTGLLQSMDRPEVEAVLGHEISHVSNGDMVTLTLIQGVLNTFVFFLSRVVGYIVDKTVFRTERGVGPGFYITMIVSQIVFGVLASAIVAWFSRYREFRADRGSANLLGTPQPMIAALSRLGGLQTGGLPDSVKTFGISSESGLAQIFATHPPIEARIAALQNPQ